MNNEISNSLNNFKELLKETILIINNDDSYSSIEKAISFIFLRLFYEEDEELIKIYNKEFEIGQTQEEMQKAFLIMFDKIFMRRFGNSPIEKNEIKGTVRMKGKVYLSKNKLIICNSQLTVV